MHDRDTKFSKEFQSAVRKAQGKLLKLPVQSPNLNSRCERVIQTIQYECLRKFIVFGKQHLDYLLTEFVEYYDRHRAQSRREFQPPASDETLPENGTITLDEVECREHLGGPRKRLRANVSHRRLRSLSGSGERNDLPFRPRLPIWWRVTALSWPGFVAEDQPPSAFIIVRTY